MTNRVLFRPKGLKETLRVVHIGAECAPFIRSGNGLSQIIGRVPEQLGKYGLNAYVFVPSFVSPNVNLPGPVEETRQALGGLTKEGQASVVKRHLPRHRNFSLYTIDHPVFQGGELYPRDEHLSLLRSSIFCLGVIRALKELHLRVDILVCHDWFAALTIAYLFEAYRHDNFFAQTKKIFTVHDIKYQGIFQSGQLAIAQLPWELFTPEAVEYHGQVSLLKAGLNFSDRVILRDRRYLETICARGNGFEGVMRKLMDEQRVVPLVEDFGPWPPEAGQEPTPEQIALWAGCEISVYRTLIDQYFRGMRYSVPLAEPFAPLRQTREERLRELNPWLSTAIYDHPDSLSRRSRDAIKAILDNGQEHLLTRIRGPQDLAILMESIGRRLKWGRVTEAVAAINSFRPLGSEAPLELVRDFPALPAPGSESFSQLVETGRAALGQVVKITNAAKHDIDIFGRNYFNTRGVHLVADNTYFLQVHAEDILRAQELSQSTVPWYIMVSPLARKKVASFFRYFNFFGLDPKQVRLIEPAPLYPALSTGQENPTIFWDKQGLGVMYFTGGAGFLPEYLRRTGLLNRLAKEGRTHLFLSTVGNLGGLLSTADYQALLGWQIQERRPLVCEMTGPRGHTGALVVRDGQGRTYAAEDYVLAQELQYEARRDTLPVLFGNYSLEIASFDRALRTGRPTFNLYPKSKQLGYGDFTTVGRSLVDLTKAFADTAYLRVPEHRLIFPRFRGEFEEAYRLYRAMVEH